MLELGYIRILFLIIILALIILFRNVKTDILNHILCSFIALSLLGEIQPYIYQGYNLLLFSIMCLSQLILIGYLVYYEISKSQLPVIIVILCLLLFGFFYLTEFSSYNLFHCGIATEQYDYPILLHQFFDLYSVVNLALIVLMFLWLFHIVNSDQYTLQDTRKRYFIIFGFLIYAGGSFFVVAFGRIILPTFEQWESLWTMIFKPIWFIFYSLLFIGLLWKPTH